MRNYLVLLLIFIPSLIFSQSFNGPESVEYDVANSRWLVGQNGSGVVLEYNPSSGLLTNFCSGMTTGPYGIEILGNVLYCCDGGWIRGYDLITGTSIFNLNLGASFLNGITSNGNDQLYVTDFSAKKIYRVDVVNSTFNIMTSTVKTPNGIIYDGLNNRCVFATWGSAAAIQAMSLLDSTITTLKTTTLSNIDGITKDLQGNWYVAAWGNNALSKLDANFVNAPVVVKTGLTSPADLGINANGDSIGIPNSGSANNVVFYVIPTSTGIIENNKNDIKFYPNPANNFVTITLDEAIVNGSIELCDVNGKILLEEKFTGYIKQLNRENLNAGIYFVNFRNQLRNIIQTKKIIYN
jgi:streptogramin lyase